MDVLAVVGMPGTGKTSLIGALLPRLGVGEPWAFGTLRGVNFPEFNAQIWGVYDQGVFSGTDRLSMSVQPSAQNYLLWQAGPMFWQSAPDAPDNRKSFVIFEGDRLGNVSFLRFCQQRTNLSIICLVTNQEAINGRYAARGSQQSDKWLKGRGTKIANICKTFSTITQVHEHNAPSDTDHLVTHILGMVNNEHRFTAKGKASRAT